jgi:hypothetical protein
MYDLTISAPKTVSIQGIIDPAMAEAHREAVAQIRQEMEHICGAMVIAQYDHGYSRKLDAQIHSHLVAGNLAHDGQKWRTLHVNEIYRAHKEITTDYRARLAEMLEGWGYKVELRHGVPELAQVPSGLKERFSQRSKQLEEAVLERANELGVRPEDIPNRAKKILVRVHREPKQYSPTQDQFRESQLSRLTDAEHSKLEEIVGQALSRSERQEIAPKVERWIAPQALPWMAQSGGVENLSQKHLASAQRSYEKWQHRDKYGFADYVAYVQQCWAENPGLLREWMANQKQAETRAQKISISNPEPYENPMLRHPWEYGQDSGDTMVSNRPRRVMRAR